MDFSDYAIKVTALFLMILLPFYSVTKLREEIAQNLLCSNTEIYRTMGILVLHVEAACF